MGGMLLEALQAGLPGLGLSLPQGRWKRCAPLARRSWRKTR